MNIYKISQDVNCGYDTFDAFVVYAENEESARNLIEFDDEGLGIYGEWVEKKDADKIKVEYIGSNQDIFDEKVILGSFNAG